MEWSVDQLLKAIVLLIGELISLFLIALIIAIVRKEEWEKRPFIRGLAVNIKTNKWWFRDK